MQNHVRSTMKLTHRTNNGRVMDIFVPGCRQNHGKGMKIEMNKAFWMIVKKATFLAHFVDQN